MSKFQHLDCCVPVESDNPAIVKNNDLCALCGHCLAVCQEEIGVQLHYDLLKNHDTAICINCGQCSANCPEEAITVRSECQAVKDAIRDPNKIVVFSTSPSVRVGLGDAFSDQPGRYVEGKMVAALKALGADYVFDVTFSADLTILEEGSELIRRITTGSAPLPQFTSCCPAWVKYVETFHPEFIPNISSAKSPIGMQGPTIKTYFAMKKQLDPSRIVNVVVTPCTAKKAEIRRPEFNAAGRLLKRPEIRDNDYCITSKELAHWLQEEGIDFNDLPDLPFDDILGKGTGAGVIFGNTGGVMEAALRYAYEVLTHQKPPETLLNFTPVRGMTGVKEASIDVAGLTLKIAVVYGTENADKFLQGDVSQYHFVEVMTCPGGCISGAGQPQCHSIPVTDAIRMQRIASLYSEDERMTLRNSCDNPEIQTIYREFYKEPLSPISEALLHTSYYDRKLEK